MASLPALSEHAPNQLPLYSGSERLRDADRCDVPQNFALTTP
jgi:hypothetical protein